MTPTEIKEKVISILLASFDKNKAISAEKAEALLNSANFDWKTESELDDLALFMEDLGDFIIEKNENGTEFIYTKELPIDKPQSELDLPTLNRRITGVIKKILTDNPNIEGFVQISTLGNELARQEIKLPNGDKLKSFLQKQANLFELDNSEGGGGMVRIFKKEAKANNIANKITANNSDNSTKPGGTQSGKRFVSLYNLFDFAAFPNYDEIKKQLAEMAEPNGWFVLEAPGEPDPYTLLHLQLRINFAMAVKQEIENHAGTISIQPDRAIFDTGFKTAEGKTILAILCLNQQRDANNWQTWKFDKFQVKDSE